MSVVVEKLIEKNRKNLKLIEKIEKVQKSSEKLKKSSKNLKNDIELKLDFFRITLKSSKKAWKKLKKSGNTSISLTFSPQKCTCF